MKAVWKSQRVGSSQSTNDGSRSAEVIQSLSIVSIVPSLQAAGVLVFVEVLFDDGSDEANQMLISGLINEREELPFLLKVI